MQRQIGKLLQEALRTVLWEVRVALDVGLIRKDDLVSRSAKFDYVLNVHVDPQPSVRRRLARGGGRTELVSGKA